MPCQNITTDSYSLESATELDPFPNEFA
ncbi:hypothetical protein AGR4B_Lc30043 [Agrobacterium tumefaciens str. CFBP 5621]|nr:hypothetical protein AGR4B_Lc30043 [Agrobacterium tumefaciens str. CFBP 5621]